MATKVLIVEDEMLIGHGFKIYLEQEGFEVVGLVADGQSALELIAEHNPDIILLDIVLKRGESGIDVANKIREQYDMPIIFTTGNSLSDTTNQTLQITRSLVVTKPVDQSELTRKINVLVEG